MPIPSFFDKTADLIERLAHERDDARREVSLAHCDLEVEKAKVDRLAYELAEARAALRWAVSGGASWSNPKFDAAIKAAREAKNGN